MAPLVGAPLRVQETSKVLNLRSQRVARIHLLVSEAGRNQLTAQTKEGAHKECPYIGGYCRAERAIDFSIDGWLESVHGAEVG